MRRISLLHLLVLFTFCIFGAALYRVSSKAERLQAKVASQQVELQRLRNPKFEPRHSDAHLVVERPERRSSQRRSIHPLLLTSGLRLRAHSKGFTQDGEPSEHTVQCRYLCSDHEGDYYEVSWRVGDEPLPMTPSLHKNPQTSALVKTGGGIVTIHNGCEIRLWIVDRKADIDKIGGG